MERFSPRVERKQSAPNVFIRPYCLNRYKTDDSYWNDPCVQHDLKLDKSDIDYSAKEPITGLYAEQALRDEICVR